jgi:predicted Rossmann-fold nucleotide-binding protein
LSEALTWAQLGLHHGATGLLNIDGFFDDVLRFIERAAAAGFIPRATLGALVVGDDPAAVIDAVVARGADRSVTS